MPPNIAMYPPCPLGTSVAVRNQKPTATLPIRVPVWINHHKASRASRAFVCFYDHVYATIFELTLQLSNVREFSEWLSIATPARVEGENVLIEHALKQPNSVVAILHN